MTRQLPTRSRVVVDDKEDAPNDNSVADSGAFVSAILGGGNITKEEGNDPK